LIGSFWREIKFIYFVCYEIVLDQKEKQNKKQKNFFPAHFFLVLFVFERKKKNGFFELKNVYSPTSFPTTTTLHQVFFFFKIEKSILINFVKSEFSKN